MSRWFEYRAPAQADKARAEAEKDPGGLLMVLQGLFLIASPLLAIGLIVWFLAAIF